MSMRNFWKVVDSVIDRSDVLLEVVDARMPYLTRNRIVENRILRKGKSFILVLNKADLITKRMRDDFLKNSMSKKSVFVSCKKRTGIADLKKAIFILSRKRRRWGKINVGVVGYPNTGKSSVINALSGRSAAKTSPVAGVTRGVQWISGGDDILFLDTPGVIPFDDKDEAERAMMSVMDPEKLKSPDLAAMKIIQLFLDNDRRGLERLYGVTVGTDDAMEILLEIGRKKNFLSKGGDIDKVRTSLRIIRDWQRGNLLLKI
ncbi:MAG: GTPase [Candidatus Aenigmatarchaeota archaeon]